MKGFVRVGPEYAEWQNIVLVSAGLALVGWVDDQLVCVAIDLGASNVSLHFLFGEAREYHEDLVEAIQDGVENGVNFEIAVLVDVAHGIELNNWEFADRPRIFLRYGAANKA